MGWLEKIFPNLWPFISTGLNNISLIWRDWGQKENGNEFQQAVPAEIYY
jgi:hypothetical protein